MLVGRRGIVVETVPGVPLDGAEVDGPPDAGETVPHLAAVSEGDVGDNAVPAGRDFDGDAVTQGTGEGVDLRDGGDQTGARRVVAVGNRSCRSPVDAFLIGRQLIRLLVDFPGRFFGIDGEGNAEHRDNTGKYAT